MKRIVDAGRLEIRGAEARFKEKGTLEAFDRNLAKLMKVRVRQTPAPKLALFADFEFDDAVFRVWQESTLIPYKEFLEKVHPTGLANFRAMIGYVTRALGENDLATKEFAGGRPPERFATNQELADYDAAISTGKAPRAREKVPAPIAAPPKERVVDEAWMEFAGDIEKERAENRRVSPLPGFTLLVMGMTFGVMSVILLRSALGMREGVEGTGPIYGFVALGLLLSLALLVVGGLFLRRAIASEAASNATSRSTSDRA